MTKNAVVWCLLFAAIMMIPAFGQSTPSPLGVAWNGPVPLRLGVAVSGIVKSIFVAQGAHVAAGQALLEIDCSVLDAEIKVRADNLAAAEAGFERTRNGPRPDEVKIGEANVGVATARAEEAADAFRRASLLREGITTTRAETLKAQRDARISAAQLVDAQRRLDLLHAGSRVEDIAEAQARYGAAAALLDEGKAEVAQCTVRAPVTGKVDLIATLGQYVSTAVPVTLAQLTPD